MRKLLFTSLCLIVLITAGGYAAWTRERPAGHYLADLRINVALNEGVPGERGNLLGIQPDLYPADYRSRHRLHLKLAAYLQQARQQGLLGPRTVVILPEHIGTWLWALGEKQELYDASDEQEALQWLALSNPLQFAQAWLGAKGEDRMADTWLRLKARSMVDNYQQLFGGLAHEFGVTLVAGSIVLPQPRVEAGRLLIGEGPLYNSSVVFGADGLVLGQPSSEHAPGRKTRHYLHSDGQQPLQVIETPAGRLGVLVGTDAGVARYWQQLNRQGADLIAVAGEPGVALPALPSNNSLGVFMSGRLWQPARPGRNFVGIQGRYVDHPEQRGAQMINLWL